MESDLASKKLLGRLTARDREEEHGERKTGAPCLAIRHDC